MGVGCVVAAVMATGIAAAVAVADATKGSLVEEFRATAPRGADAVSAVYGTVDIAAAPAPAAVFV